MLDLSKLMTKVEEFNDCGDMDMMQQYVKDVMQVGYWLTGKFISQIWFCERSRDSSSTIFTYHLWLMELFVSQVQKKINELTGEIEFINKEEELFQWEISNYCEIEQVRKNK